MATPTKKPTAQVNTWDEELAKEAQIAKAREDKQAAGSNSFTTSGGILKLDGNPIPGNSMDVVILHSVALNQFYKNAWDPKNPVPPDCFAFEDENGDMAPHKMAADKQCEDCATCPLNAFGSAKDNRGQPAEGKACKNGRRLAVIAAGKAGAGKFIFDKADELKVADIRLLTLPPTSLKSWAQYVKGLANTLNVPPFAMVSRITLVPEKTYFKVQVDALERVPNDLIPVLMARRGEAKEEATKPFQPMAPKATPQQTGKKGRSFTK